MSVREKAEKSYIRFIQRPNPNYGEAETSLNQLLKSVKDPNRCAFFRFYSCQITLVLY